MDTYTVSFFKYSMSGRSIGSPGTRVGQNKAVSFVFSPLFLTLCVIQRRSAFVMQGDKQAQAAFGSKCRKADKINLPPIGGLSLRI